MTGEGRLSFMVQAGSGTLALPEWVTPDSSAGGWMVTVYDNERNTYEEVIGILMTATSCAHDEAYAEAWEIDHWGRCNVHFGNHEECLSAAKIIATIGIEVEVSVEY